MKAQWDQVEATELYDHVNDPFETRNIAEENQELVKELTVPLYDFFGNL